jgi:hypothetical protein
MVKSMSQHQKKYRELTEEYRIAERKRAKRDRDGYTDEQKAVKREQGRKRMQELRKRKKEAEEKLKRQAEIETPYKTKSAEKRAVNRVLAQVKSRMPHSPRKRTFLKATVAHQLLGTLPSKISTKRSTLLSADIVDIIVKFYQEDDVSQMSPGKRDCVRDGKVFIQKVRIV